MKKILSLSVILLICLLNLPAVTAKEEEHPPRLIDTAGVIDTQTMLSLTEKLDRISIKQNCDLVVFVTTIDIQTGSGSLGESMFESLNYGMGKDKRGILLIINAASNTINIQRSGSAFSLINSDDISYIINRIYSDLKNSNYIEAIKTFADLCDSSISKNTSGQKADISGISKYIYLPIWIPISIALGLAAGFLKTNAMKKELKSVKEATGAISYIKDQKMTLTSHSDILIYKDVHSAPLTKNDSELRL